MKDSYYIGKGVPPTENDNSPITGESNTNYDFYESKTGRFIRRRKIGVNGVAIKDLDVADEHKKKDHVHVFHGTFRSKKDIDPNKKERRELKKAKRKRRPLNERFNKI